MLLLALFAAGCAGASAALAPPSAYIGIIIDDLGNSRHGGELAVRLPGPVACAILPGTPYAALLARMARRHGKEVLLHLPMEPVAGLNPGPGALDTAMSRTLFTLTLDADLDSIPGVAGVNNHMGSLLTSRTIPMEWLMRTLSQRGGLFFVDSRTIAASVAARTAAAYRVPALSRDVFLDDVPTAGAVEQQLALLLRIAHRRGYALAIGHPHSATLDVLRQWLPLLALRRVRLVPLSTLLALRSGRALPWAPGPARPPGAVGQALPRLPDQDDPSLAWP